MDRYEKLDKIGSGTYGMVHLIRRRADGHLFALKRVPVERNATQETISINNEIKVLRSLNHANVVQYHDSFIEKEYIHIVMDFCERGDMNRRIKKAKSSNKCFA